VKEIGMENGTMEGRYERKKEKGKGTVLT